MTTPPETLRAAAALMRERAAAATPGRWGVFGMTVLASTDGTSNVDTAVEVAQALTVDDAGRPRTWDADYIATAHPPFILAVADMLDAFATDWEITGADASPIHPVVRVATTYLGESS